MESLIGERLKIARRLAGLSQQEVADRLGISRMAVSKYESGELVPNSARLIQFAQALRQPLEFLLRGPVEVNLRPFHPQTVSLPRAQAQRLTAQAQEWLERYLKVESLFPPAEHPAFHWPPGLPRPAAAAEAVEQAAQDLRRAWRLGDAPVENLAEVLEDHGIKVGSLDANGIEAVTFLHGTAPVIVFNASLSQQALRDALARELGLFALRSDDTLDAQQVAARFGRALLVPAAVVRRALGSRRHHLDLWELHVLEHKYGLSIAGCVQRAQELGIVAPAYAKRLLTEVGRHAAHRHAPGQAQAAELPSRMERLIVRALSEGVISEQRAAELMGRPWSEFAQAQHRLHGVEPLAVRA